MKKFAVILAFDVPVSKEASDLGEELGVRIMTADIIYHLFDQFTDYLKVVSRSSPPFFFANDACELPISIYCQSILGEATVSTQSLRC